MTDTLTSRLPVALRACDWNVEISLKLDEGRTLISSSSLAESMSEVLFDKIRDGALVTVHVVTAEFAAGLNEFLSLWQQKKGAKVQLRVVLLDRENNPVMCHDFVSSEMHVDPYSLSALEGSKMCTKLEWKLKNKECLMFQIFTKEEAEQDVMHVQV